MSTQILQTLYKMVADDNSGDIEFHGPFIHPKGHDLQLCSQLASQLTEDDQLFIAAGDPDERGWWLESHPHMAPLNNLLNDFFNMAWGSSSP